MVQKAASASAEKTQKAAANSINIFSNRAPSLTEISDENMPGRGNMHIKGARLAVEANSRSHEPNNGNNKLHKIIINEIVERRTNEMFCRNIYIYRRVLHHFPTVWHQNSSLWPGLCETAHLSHSHIVCCCR